jgi:hypothetical protein
MPKNLNTIHSLHYRLMRIVGHNQEGIWVQVGSRNFQCLHHQSLLNPIVRTNMAKLYLSHETTYYLQVISSY